MTRRHHELRFDGAREPDAATLVAVLDMAIVNIEPVRIMTEGRPDLIVWTKRGSAGPYFVTVDPSTLEMVVYASAWALVAAVLPAYLACRSDESTDEAT